MPEEKRHTAVYLMRAGERKSGDPSSGLSEESRAYIANLAKFEFPKFAFDKVLLTPSPVVRETLEVFLRSAPQFVLTAALVIEERPEIYSERMPEWGVIVKAKPVEEIKTLLDLEDAQTLAVANGTLSQKDFVFSEGERIFTFIAEAEKSLKDQEIMLCFMQKPLPEAVVLWLTKNKVSPSVTKIKTSAFVEALDYLDAYALLFQQGEFNMVLHNKFRKKVEEALQNEEFKLEVKLRGKSRK